MWHHWMLPSPLKPLHPLSKQFERDPQSDRDFETSLAEHMRAASISSITNLSQSISIDEVKEAGQADEQYTDLLRLIQSGFPRSRNKVQPPHLREFWGVKDRLTVIDDVALMDSRIVVPRSLRKQIMSNLHAANQGMSGMKARANQTVYWPGMDAQMKNFKDTCADCLENSPSQQAEPLMLTPSPEWPFQQICMDYFDLGHTYLSIVDRFSAWLSIYHIKNGEATSQMLITICREFFIAYGAPEEISSDGGPQLTANKFKEFLESWGVKHRISSVAYPQSNGRAELGVKAAKRIIHNNVSADGSVNNDQAARAILQYRNTPLPDINLSPAQILFHRQLRDSIPAVPSHYRLHKDWILSAKEREAALAKRNHRIIERYDTSTRLLQPLKVGTKVVVQTQNNIGKKKWVKTGRIVEALDNRQYRIRMCHSGRITLQNRKFIKECQLITAPMPMPTPFMGSPTQQGQQPASPHPEPQLAPQPESSSQPSSSPSQQVLQPMLSQSSLQPATQEVLQPMSQSTSQPAPQQVSQPTSQLRVHFQQDSQPAPQSAPQTPVEAAQKGQRGRRLSRKALKESRLRNLQGGRNNQEENN